MRESTLPYEYAFSIRDELLDIYISRGRRGFAERLNITTAGSGHVLKYLGFYSDDVQKLRRDREIEELKKPRCINPFRPFNDISSYILGFIVGDGSLRSSYDDRVLDTRLSISCNDRHIIREIGEYFGFGDDCISEKTKINNPNFVIGTDDYETIKDLKSFGVRERKSWVGCDLDFPLEFISHFVRGLFDANGYVRVVGSNSSPRLYVSICSHKTVIEFISKNTDIRWKVDLNDKLSFLNLYEKEEVKKLYEYMYKDAKIKLERKWERFYEYYVNGRESEQYRVYRV